MITIKRIFLILSISTFAFMLGACVDQEFEQPQPWDRPVGTVLTVAQLRAMFTGSPVTFDQDYSVYATVSFDDKSGNLWRSAYVQDHTAGINLRLQAPGGLFEGDSVRIFLRGTVLNSYMEMLQLDNVNVDWNIIKQATNRPVTPRLVRITDLLSNTLQGQLIQLDNVQFSVSELGNTFADAQNLVTHNRVLEDCSGNRIIVRTSGFANFAGQTLPTGSGSLIAVAARFGSDFQIFLRRASEVQLTNSRCPLPGDGFTRITIANLRQNFAEGFTRIPPNIRIEGVVISDMENDNHPGQNLFLFDESGAGIALRFAAFHDFPVGTRLRVLVSNMTMARFNGLLQIADIPLGNGVNLGQGTLPQPAQVTIGGILQNPERYESQLVTIRSVTISGGATFSGSRTITDATGSMALFTHSWATFANTPIPTGTVTITGISSIFNTPQIMLRNMNDIRTN
jgi:hypothetical protein